MPLLILPTSLHAQLLAEAQAASPRECCGLLEGVREGDGIRITALHSSANLAEDPLNGFEIDPTVHFRLLRALRGTGRAVVGCYHSHPNGRAQPSSRDRANGCEDGFVWIIVAVAAETTAAAFIGPKFDPLAIQVSP
jgi:proteasome lid subunit RPN8/RPN11